MSDSGYGRFSGSGKSVTARLGSRAAEAADLLFDDMPEEKKERPGMPRKEDRPTDFMDIDVLSKEDGGAGDGDEQRTFDEMLGDGGDAEPEPGDGGGKKPEKKEGKDADDKDGDGKGAGKKDGGKKEGGKKEGKDDDDKGPEKRPENAVSDAAEAAEGLAESLEDLAEVFDDLKS